MFEPIRVMIIDDSSVVRRAVTEALSHDPDISIVGTASNGKIALQRIAQWSPEVLILDLEMPEADGFELLRALRVDFPKIRTIMFSSATQRGAVQTIEALSLGASDYVAKPTTTHPGGYSEAVRQVAAELIPKIKQFRPHPAWTKPLQKGAKQVEELTVERVLRSTPQTVGIVAIGVSTGGPAALSKLIPELSKDFPVPIVIVQHMPPVFTRMLAERLQQGNGVKVVEGVDGMILEPGTAYIAPGNYHMAVRQKEGRVFLAMNQEPPVNYCRPSVDVLFRSVAEVYREETLGIIMTGMGQDGLNGIRAMKSKGAIIFAQDQASSVVWGMPSFVVREGLADCVLPLDEMRGAIEDCVMKRMRA
ncbi:MAG: chemotaxis response regulator protein-glutamate methylesterase [Candidatus Manganitrophus sp. SB1]|nr:chemotaxis response regulator protein-glutamate methylesterase [Candidatus Manganitrophus morganii]